jgi:2'-5' RNA ligase
MKKGYSLWIPIEGDIESTLYIQIKVLSKKYSTPLFHPHLTILGGIDDDENSVLKKVRQIAENTRQFPLELSNVSISTTYFQCVFVRVKATAELLDLRIRSEEVFKKDVGMYMPHISLIYSEADMKAREKIASEIKLPKTSFTASGLSIIEFDIENIDPSAWDVVRNFELS